MKRFMMGFQILCKYTPDGNISAEHDEVYCEGPEPSKMTAAERKTLEATGWSWDSDHESWHKFV